MTRTAYRVTLTMQERISQVNHMLGRRYGNLSPSAKLIADPGLIRHFRACAKNDNAPGADAIREIIDDAKKGVSFYAEIDNDSYDKHF